MGLVQTFGLFVLTAVAEIVGCYLPYLWLREGRSAWLLIPVIPAAISLGLFAWLLTLHPTSAGRVYAAALIWLWGIDGIKPTAWDIVGAGVTILGTAIIVLGARSA